MRGNLVRLKGSSGRYALVFIHPASGSAASFRALQPRLGSDCSVYAFQAPGIDPGRPHSIEGIAETYLAEFQGADSRSIPIFVRWPFSGPVAVEMARLGEEQGRGPAGVILLDSATHEVLGGRTTDRATEIGGLFGIDLSGTDARSVDGLLDHAAELIAVASDTPGLTGADLRPFWDIHARHQGIFDDGWQARSCAASPLMVRARDETGWNAEPGRPAAQLPHAEGRYVVPRFVERTAQGVRECDPYAKLFEERIIFLGVQLDDASANDIMAQLVCLESMDPDRDITIYINSPGGSFTALTAIYDTMQYVKPAIQTVCLGQARVPA